MRLQPPVWPTDKQLALRECFHFAACARFVGKIATLERRSIRARVDSADTDEGLEVSSMHTASSTAKNDQPSVVNAWRALASCDGLTGSPLGSPVKQGFDWTLAWLCSALTYGGQVVVQNAERRLSIGTRNSDNAGNDKTDPIVITPTDFDCRPEGYASQENEMMTHPKPIPEVIANLHRILDNGDSTLRDVDHELKYCMGVLEYIVARLTSPQVVTSSRQGLHFGEHKTGCFLNLHCGHNNQYTAEERQRLRDLIEEALRT